jgi:octaprenyl-diphosphate synthase
MSLKELRKYLGKDMVAVQDLIRKSLVSDIAILNKANETLLANGGKQVRPMLTLLSAKVCSGGYITGDTIRFAAAAELLHNATLLHDDVADNGKMRRGHPTVMSLLGGRASVLLGDFWLVKAMDQILDSDNNSEEVIRIFAYTLSDLAEGEMFQLQKADTCDTTEDDYMRIIYDKTASLFHVAAIAGAISVSASKEKFKAIGDYADNIGYAFQIKDDIFDYLESGTSIGKPVGQDIMERKITLPLLGAFVNAGEDASMEVRRKIRDIGSHPELKADVVKFVRDNGGIEYATGRLQNFSLNAVASLRAFPDGPDKEWLKSLAEYVGDRSR